MKWIGQHIWDFISRFRNDIYLENINSGTIASGGNLGLDSNNKIVKASDVSPVTSVNVTDSTSMTFFPIVFHDESNGLLDDTGAFEYNPGTGSLLFQNNLLTNFTLDNIANTAVPGQITLNNSRGGAAGTADDTIGKIWFKGNNNAGSPESINFAQIVGRIGDNVDGAEAGRLEFNVAEYDGTLTTGLKLDGNTDADGEIDVTIGTGAASVTTIAGTLTMGSTAFVNNTGVVQVATQGTIDHDSLANFVTAEHVDWAGASAGTIHSTNIPTLNQSTTGQAGTVATIAGLAPNTATTQAAQPNITTMTGFVTGSANQLITDDGDGTVTSESGLTWDGDDFTITSATTARPDVYIKATANHAKPPHLYFKKDKGAAGANGDQPGLIAFIGDNAAQTQKTFAQIITFAAEVTAGDEAGQMNLEVASSNGTTSASKNAFTAIGSSSAYQVDTSIGFGTSSTATITGNAMVTGNIELGHADDTTIARSSAGVVTVQGRTVALGTELAGHDENVILKQVKVTLSKADVNGLHTTPIQLVAAQGANTIIVFSQAIMRVTRALTQNNSACDMAFHYDGQEPGTNFSESVMFLRRFMYNESGDRTYSLMPIINGHIAQNLTDTVNKALEVSLDSAALLNSTNGTDIWLTYYVIDIS